MTMETQTREERDAALDRFASMAPDSYVQLPAPVAAQAMQVVGAQQVAVHRDEAQVLQRLKVLAAAAGDDWYYRFPVQNKKLNRTDYIEGPSIKLANDLARLYGNCEVDCRAQDLGSAILYHARFLDLETGFALTRPFQQRKGASKLGGGDAARAEDITFQIGASKAIRNVVVNALQTFADFAFNEAKQALVDKIGRDVEKWRTRIVERISAKVELVRVEAVIGRKADVWLAPDIARVIAMGKAVDDGMATWDETFPPIRTMNEKTTGEVLDQFAAAADPNSHLGSSDEATGAEATGAERTIDPPSEAAPVADERAMVGPKQGEVAKALQRNAIDTAIRLAGNTQLKLEEKLEQLDQLGPLLDGCSDAFIATVVKTAGEVANGKMKPADARRYLEGMMK